MTTEATNLKDVSGKVATTKHTNDETEDQKETKDAASQNQAEESENETE